MDLLIKIPLVFGTVLVGAALVYLVFRLASKAYYKSKIEYDKEKKHGRTNNGNASGPV